MIVIDKSAGIANGTRCNSYRLITDTSIDRLAVEVGFYTGRNWFVTDGGGWSEPRYKVLYWLPTPKAPDTPDKYRVSR